MIKKIVLASNNPGKVREIGQLLAGLDIEVVPQSDFNIPEIEETGLTFVENAILKARNAARLSNLPALADDSGIEVDAFKGAPGIYSARFAGVGASDAQNLEKLLTELQSLDSPVRTARFQCLMVLMTHAGDPTPLICQGTWEGEIIDTPKGDNGFGYDPIFYVANEKCTSAQLPAEKKNALSHRGQALSCLLNKLSKL
ncbi:Nucleoside 5-triphosphatase RdgB (dHAPTP, dITP, XTP-specific) [hydrothermal vent metagenome]|uniref:dITP/XTP pyrophosphatase n=1 Tax=hydrothermal vent metagenome TaxID=652676 RepID=A0A3B1AKF9_9ZZZZ